MFQGIYWKKMGKRLSSGSPPSRMPEMKYLTRFILVFILILILSSVLYAPVLMVPYAHHDDLSFFERAPQAWAKHPFHDLTFAIGRFLAAWIITIQGWFVNRLADLSIIRFVCLIVFSLCAAINDQTFKKYIHHSSYLILITVITLTLPSFFAVIGYAGMSFVAFSVLFASLAIWIVDRPVRTPWRMAAAFLFMLAALATYQPGAMFYWPLLYAIYLWDHSPRPQKRAKMIELGCLGFISILVYGGILLAAKTFLIDQTGGMYNPYQVTGRILHKFIWFFLEPVPNAINLWNIFPSWSNVIVFFAVLFATAVIAWTQQKTSWTTQIKNTGVFCVFLVLSFLPNLLAVGDAAWYRCCLPLTVLFGILILKLFSISIQSLCPPKFQKSIIISLLLGAGIFASLMASATIILYRVLPSYHETHYIITKIAEAHDNNMAFTNTHLIRPARASVRGRYDEFGVLSSHYKDNTAAFFKLAYRELGQESTLYTNKMSFSHHLENDPNPVIPADSLIIDIPRLLQTEPSLSRIRR
jgi:hypothetical protein